VTERYWQAYERQEMPPPNSIRPIHDHVDVKFRVDEDFYDVVPLSFDYIRFFLF
jgi:hypothetical protein